jgi:hypothetical protein
VPPWFGYAGDRILLAFPMTRLAFANIWGTNWTLTLLSGSLHSTQRSPRQHRRKTLMPDQGPRIRSTHSADGGIIMNIESGKMFSLNPSGSVMFQLLTQGLDQKSIVDELVRRFGISAAVAKHDLDEFRNALNGHGLILGEEVIAPE